MSYLAEIHGDQKLPARTIGYVSESTRDALYDLVVRKFMETGITQAVLAKRLGKSPAQICRTLGASGNWTIDTVAELLYAIDGSMLKVSSFQPHTQAKANRIGSVCLEEFHERNWPARKHQPRTEETINLNGALKLQFEGV